VDSKKRNEQLEGTVEALQRNTIRSTGDAAKATAEIEVTQFSGMCVEDRMKAKKVLMRKQPS
jgi:hypothetical protein